MRPYFPDGPHEIPKIDFWIVNDPCLTYHALSTWLSDGSQFTSSGAAGPTLTIVTLAIRQADRIAELMGSGEI